MGIKSLYFWGGGSLLIATCLIDSILLTISIKKSTNMNWYKYAITSLSLMLFGLLTSVFIDNHYRILANFIAMSIIVYISSRNKDEPLLSGFLFLIIYSIEKPVVLTFQNLLIAFIVVNAVKTALISILYHSSKIQVKLNLIPVHYRAIVLFMAFVFLLIGASN